MTNYPPHLLRMIAEADELAVRIKAACEFLASAHSWNLLDETDRVLLSEQHHAMSHYHTLLTVRIEREKAKV
ncbi:TPA: hypothetical protein ACGQ50_000840 [Enterobacter cloacae]